MDFDTEPWYEYLETAAKLLAPTARIALAASIVERLYPTFAGFASQYDLDDAPTVRSALDDIWYASTRLDQWDAEAWEARAPLLQLVAPVSETFTSVLTSSAENAVLALLTAGALCSDPDDVSQIVAVSKLAAESIYVYLVLVTGPLSGDMSNDDNAEWTEKSALFSEEMNQEVNALQALQGVVEVTDEVISTLTRSRTGVQPFLRGLICLKDPDPFGAES